MTDTAHRALQKTKIVATLGPAASEQAVLRAMIRSGMNIARVNFSHGDHESNAALIKAVRGAAQRERYPVAILQDLCGPKIRIGDFQEESVTLVPGKPFTLTSRACRGDATRVSVNYKRLPREVAPGMAILLNDGKVHLRVTAVKGTDIHTKVVTGGEIRGRRGVNVPGAHLSLSAITRKDRRDIALGKKLGVHFMTLSFIRRAREITQLRTLLGPQARRVGIVAKIETAEALDDLDAIIESADAVMVARGDLAIEIPAEEVPLVQKDIIARCNRAGTPVITATQMLDSMREQTRPTRAEVNDVAGAVFDGTDAVMLSEETALGQHPAIVIKTMADIAQHIEASDAYRRTCESRVFPTETTADIVTNGIAEAALTSDAALVVALSESGRTARLIARHRPSQTILVLTPSESTLYRSLLCFGCHPVLCERVHSLSEAVAAACAAIKRSRLARRGDLFVLGAGIPFNKKGSTSMLALERVK